MGVKVSAKRRQKTIQEGEFVYIVQNIIAREKLWADDGTTSVMQVVDRETLQVVNKEVLDTGTYQSKVLTKGLVSWNLEDEKGTIIPVSQDNIGTFLPIGHIDLLFREIMLLSQLSETQKKTLNAPSVIAEE